jgi:hypothetical protein
VDTLLAIMSSEDESSVASEASEASCFENGLEICEYSQSIRESIERNGCLLQDTMDDERPSSLEDT